MYNVNINSIKSYNLVCFTSCVVVSVGDSRRFSVGKSTFARSALFNMVKRVPLREKELLYEFNTRPGSRFKILCLRVRVSPALNLVIRLVPGNVVLERTNDLIFLWVFLLSHKSIYFVTLACAHL